MLKQNNSIFEIVNLMNTLQPSVSVIIPAYNAEKYLVETLVSVFNQTYRNIEVIVINDGSIDNTLNILQQFQQNEPRLKIIDQPNQGISAARNAGINNASGNFIAFIDSDDKWDASFLSKMILRQQQTNGDIIYTGNSELSSKGIRIRKSDFREKTNLVGYLSEKSLLHVGCLLIKKQFLDQHNIRFKNNLKTGEDILFICSLFCLSNAFCVPEHLYFYIYRDDSVMHKKWTRKDYLLDLSAWEILEKTIKSTYQGNDRNEAIALIGAKIVYYKLRLLWILLLAGRYDELKTMLNDGFLKYSSNDLALIPPKYAGIRRKIIESKSSIIWSITKLVCHKKVNLA